MIFIWFSIWVSIWVSYDFQYGFHMFDLSEMMKGFSYWFIELAFDESFSHCQGHHVGYSKSCPEKWLFHLTPMSVKWWLTFQNS